MANELRIPDETGLTYTCEVRETDGTLLDTVSLAESGSTGRYYGDFPSGTATADTTYDLIYVEDSTARATQTVRWNGSKLLGVEDTITATGFSTHNAATVWRYAVRTLTSSASQTANAASGAALAVTRGVTFTHTFTGSIPENWQRFIFTAKDEDCQRDEDAIIQVLITNSGGDSDGALVLEGATATAGQASLEVDQPGGTVDLTIHDDATAQMLLRAGADYDVKMILDDSTSSVFESSTFSVEATATWTT